MKNYYYYIFHLFYIFALLAGSRTVHAQKTGKALNTTEKLIRQANQLSMNGKKAELLILSNQIIDHSQKIDSEKGLAYGYYYLASCFSYDKKYTESNIYLKKAQSYTSYLASDPRQNFRIQGLMADNYRDLELYQLAIASYHRSQQFLNHIEGKDVIDSLSEGTNYDNISMLYAAMNRNDSVYHYLNKEKYILKHITFEDAYIEKSSCFLGLGTYHFAENNIDSAAYYYDKSLELLQGKNHPMEVSAYISKAELLEKDDIDGALVYYHKALEKAIEHELPDVEADIYKSLANSYTHKSLYKEANLYQKKHIKLKEELQKSKAQQRDIIVNQVMNQEKKKFEGSLSGLHLKTYVIIGIFSLCLLIAFFLANKYKNKNVAIKSETEKLLTEKETIISQKEVEAQVLHLKLNESFESVVKLAKENSPEFFSRFQEVYPQFVTELTAVNDKLRLSELTLLAYIFLGFNTKDISAYTFKSVYTIRSRKYNLRKKLELSPEENMEVWLKNIVLRP